MNQKTWIQLKRSLEISITMNNEAKISIKGNEEEKFPYQKEAALEETIKNLHQQVACLKGECNVKDKLISEHVKTSQQANTGREKAEVEVAKRKRELEDMLQHKVAANERLVRLNAALKNCRQQLSSSKVEHDRRVNLEREHKRLESKYTEARKKLANLTVENARLTKALVKKEEIIEDVNNQMSEATAEFNKLISRLDFTKKGNDVLKYEYRVLERDLKMRNRRADVENRNVAKLEAERRKLRLLVRKRIPGPTKTKPRNHPKTVERRTSVMIKRLREVEEENKILKESESEKEKEIRLLEAELTRMRFDEKLLESENRIIDLKSELERLKELKRMTDDHFENLRLINVDLDHQLFAANLQIKEAFRKVSFLEMELEDRSHHFEGLEATCLELQLQLASVSGKDVVSEDYEQEGKLLQNGSEITSEMANNKKSSQGTSLRDRMAADDGIDTEDLLNSSMIKEIITTKETKKEPIGPHHNTLNTSYGVKNIVPRTFPVVRSKQRGKGIELLRKLLYRRKRGGNKKKLLLFATNRADLIRN